MNSQQQPTKPENQIRIGINSRVGSIIRYVNLLIKDNKFKFYDFSAIGGAIGKLVSAVELIKLVNPGLFQVNKISTVSIDTKDPKSDQVQRLYPKLEVILSLDEPKEKGEGYQAALPETQRLKLFELLNKSTVSRGGRGGDRGFAGDRGGRGRGFGGRGRGYVPRGRGGYGEEEGQGFRGSRGFGGERGRGRGFGGERGRGRGFGGERGRGRGFGGERGGYVPRGRGGFGGDEEGQGFRGGRGGFRGERRGGRGFGGAPRGERRGRGNNFF